MLFSVRESTSRHCYRDDPAQHHRTAFVRREQVSASIRFYTSNSNGRGPLSPALYRISLICEATIMTTEYVYFWLYSPLVDHVDDMCYSTSRSINPRRKMMISCTRDAWRWGLRCIVLARLWKIWMSWYRRDICTT